MSSKVIMSPSGRWSWEAGWKHSQSRLCCLHTPCIWCSLSHSCHRGSLMENSLVKHIPGNLPLVQWTNDPLSRRLAQNPSGGQITRLSTEDSESAGRVEKHFAVAAWEQFRCRCLQVLSFPSLPPLDVTPVSSEDSFPLMG